MRASCETHTHTFIIPGGAGGLGLHPGRLAAADVTAHKQFGLVHPRVRRSNELAAASEMHPFYQRCARREGGHGPAARGIFLRVRDAVVRWNIHIYIIYIYVCIVDICMCIHWSPCSSVRFSSWLVRERLGRGTGKRFIRYIALFSSSFFLGYALDESSLLLI